RERQPPVPRLVAHAGARGPRRGRPRRDAGLGQALRAEVRRVRRPRRARPPRRGDRRGAARMSVGDSAVAPPRPDAPRRELPWIENRATTGLLPRLRLRELWAYRELALALALKTLRVRYKQTVFG